MLLRISKNVLMDLIKRLMNILKPSSVSNGFVSSIIYDKCYDFDFDILIFSFLDGDFPRRPSHEVYISQINRFAVVYSHVTDLNPRNKSLTAKRLQQCYDIINKVKLSQNFIAATLNYFSKFNIGWYD